MARIRIGTSGWHYDHWVGPFYPAGTKPRDFLACYTRRFDTVEINRSFYRLPTRKGLSGLRDATPPGFRFAVKGSRFTSHMKKLKDPQASAGRFFAVVDALGEKLGPILYQLPPRWRANPERLATFLEGVPGEHRYAFEFRDETWFRADVYAILERHNAALCAWDLDRRQSPIEITADFAYVRLHGPEGAYQGSYDRRALETWADRLLAWRAEGRDVWCFFDNDEAGYAAKDAARLAEMVGRR